MTDTEHEQEIIDPSNLRHYRTELPNLYDEFDLNPYERTLLMHYVRRGNCYEGTRISGFWCGMSHAKVIYTRRKLVDKGLIIAEKTKYGTWSITIVDIWRENFIYFASTSKKNKRLRGNRLQSNQGGYDVTDEATKSLVNRLRRNPKNLKEEQIRISADKTADEKGKVSKVKTKVVPESNPLYRPMFDILIKVTFSDPKMSASLIGKFANKILAGGYTVEQVSICFIKPTGLWYTLGGKGFYGTPPTIYEVADKISVLWARRNETPTNKPGNSKDGKTLILGYRPDVKAEDTVDSMARVFAEGMPKEIVV